MLLRLKPKLHHVVPTSKPCHRLGPGVGSRLGGSGCRDLRGVEDLLQERAVPYSFAKPACSTAEPQTPRDLTAGAVGQMTPKAATLTDDQANFLPLVNVHFHLGAEHKTEAGPGSPKSSSPEVSHEFGARR